jgi:Calpain family cysteine protease
VYSCAKRPAVLTATADLEACIRDCQAEVNKIIAQCKRSGVKYTDADFPVTVDPLSCIYSDPRCPSEYVDAPHTWDRLSTALSKPQLFVEGTAPGDILQGGCGTCYLLGSMATISVQQSFAEQLFVQYDLVSHDSCWLDCINCVLVKAFALMLLCMTTCD